MRVESLVEIEIRAPEDNNSPLPDALLVFEPGQEDLAKERLLALFAEEREVAVYRLPLTAESLKTSRLFALPEKILEHSVPAWDFLFPLVGKSLKVADALELLARRMRKRLATPLEAEEVINRLSRRTGLRRRLLRTIYGFIKRSLYGKNATRTGKKLYPWWKHVKPRI